MIQLYHRLLLDHASHQFDETSLCQIDKAIEGNRAFSDINCARFEGLLGFGFDYVACFDRMVGCCTVRYRKVSHSGLRF